MSQKRSKRFSVSSPATVEQVRLYTLTLVRPTSQDWYIFTHMTLRTAARLRSVPTKDHPICLFHGAQVGAAAQAVAMQTFFDVIHPLRWICPIPAIVEEPCAIAITVRPS